MLCITLPCGEPSSRYCPFQQPETVFLACLRTMQAGLLGQMFESDIMELLSVVAQHAAVSHSYSFFYLTTM